MKERSRMLSIVIFIMTLMAAGAVQAGNLKDVGGASLILTNGRICTEAGTAEAMAIEKHGVIVAVGSADMLDQYKVSDTRVIDLAGDTVLPGFHDNHVHAMLSGLGQAECNFPIESTVKQVQETIAKCLKAKEKGEWITGGLWEASALGGIPHRRMLDKVAPDNPVLLTSMDHHSSWANSLALEMAGITKDTPNPEGGIIERDGEGHPTGVLRESAGRLVSSFVPPPTPEENEAALEWALHEMLSYGITSLTAALVDKEIAEAYVALADAGKLKQRVRLCLTTRPDYAYGSTSDEDVSSLIAERNLYARDRLCPDCVKIFLDGVPFDAHTAAMLEPYEGTVEGRDDEASRYGLLLVPTEELKQAVTRYDAMGLTVKFHAAGDAAVRQAFDAIEAARLANGYSGQYHNPAHCGFVQMSDIRRARNIAATFEMSPYCWYPFAGYLSAIKEIGRERMKRMTPVKDAIDAGGLVVPGSDWPVMGFVNPWIAVETLVTHQKPGGSDETLAEGQKITLKQAIDLFTVNSAKYMGNADKTGRIEPGMLADLIVIDRNPYEIPITEVHKIIVKKTIINGEVVYDRARKE